MSNQRNYCFSVINSLEIDGSRLLRGSQEGNSYSNGRTENNVKNHFYSVLRKGMRRFNKLGGVSMGRNPSKKLSSVQLFKIVVAADDVFDNKLALSEGLK